jgi:hypothetical protein
MSRAPTDLRNYFSYGPQLRPDAAPTDQSVAPAVQRKGTGELQALAQSLQQIVPEVGQIANRQLEGAKEVDVQQAKEFYAKARFQNINDFQQAVKDGKIPEGRTPWFQIQLGQSTAEAQMNNAMRSALQEFQTSDKLVDSTGKPLRDSDNLAEVNKFFSDRMGQEMQGMDAWQSEVGLPLAQQNVNRLMGYYQAERDENRQIEKQGAFKANASNDLAGIGPQTFTDAQNPDPKISGPAQQALAAAQANLQHRIDNEILTSHPSKVKEWVNQVLESSALEKQDSRIFSQLYMGLKKKDGTPLDNSASAKDQVTRINREVVQRQVGMMHLEQEKIALQDEKDWRVMLGNLSDDITSHKQADPNWNVTKYTDAEIFAMMKKAPPALQERVLQTMSQQSIEQGQISNTRTQQQYKEEVANLSDKLASGALINDPDFRSSFWKTALKLGEWTGFHTLETESFQASRQWPPQSDPESVATLYSLRNDNNLTADDVEYAREKGSLSEADYHGFIEHAIANKAGKTEKLLPTMRTAEQQLFNQIEMAHYDNAVAKGIPTNAAATFEAQGYSKKDAAWAYARSTADYQINRADAQVKFNEQMNGLLHDKEYMALPPDQQQQRLQGIVDQIAKDGHGGYDKAEYDKSRQAVAAKTEQPAPKSEFSNNVPKEMPKPLTPEYSVMKATLSKAYPAHMEIPAEATTTAQALLKQVPPLSHDTLHKLAPPVNPGSDISWWKDPSPSNLTQWAARSRWHIRDNQGNDGPPIPDGNGDYISFEQLVDRIRSKAQKQEARFTPAMRDEYLELTKAGKQAGGLDPGSWTRLRSLENLRTGIAYYREAGGWSSDEVAQMIAEGNKDAWRSHAVYAKLPTDPKVFATDMKKFGLEPANQLQLQNFIQTQAALTEALRTHQ